MERAGEQPREVPPPAGEAVRLEAHASDQARVNQAARDLHVHYGDGVRGGRRAEPGAATAECPYPGLASFGRNQARWFFGREQLTAELIARLDGRLRTGGVQVVMAPSGAGKSSLLRAGLLPKLGSGALPGSSRWPTVVFTPTAQPLQALATQIAALTGADRVSVAKQLVADSQRGGALPRGRIRGGDSGTRLVMVVDQFEELFTLCADDRQRRTFIELLAQIADPQSGAGADSHPVGLVVVGVRADFYAVCVNYPHLRTALQDGPLAVGPMSDAELRAAILYPAREVGLDVEPGLLELLLRDLGDTAAGAGEGGTARYEAGRLPLLAHALRATWQQRHGHILTVDGYRSTGGIRQAVATTADRIFAGLDPAGQHVARTLFLRLIRIGDGTEDTRRRTARTDLLQGLDLASALPVLDAFTRGRLLTQEQDTIEITHEALLRAWPQLRQWIDTDRAGNLTRQELEEAAAVWTRDRYDTAGLYRGSRLEAAYTWSISEPNEGDLSPAASAFLAASAERERRGARLRRRVLVVLTVLALVASGAAIFAFLQTGAAQRERDTAIFNQITAQADRLRSTDVSLAAQLDLTAYRMKPETSNLYTALVNTGNVALSTPMTDHTDAVNAVVFSPDGRTLATGSADKTVRLWNVADPTRHTPLGQPLAGHTDAVNAVVFSPDGRTLVTGGADEIVRLWDVSNPAHPTPLGPPLTGHTGPVNAVVFSPDGRTLATGSADKTVRLWNVADPAHLTPVGPPLTGHTDAVKAVGFSPNGRTLATGSADETVRLWDVSDPANPTPLGTPLTDHVNSVNAVVFSPDGRTLVTGSADVSVRWWNVADPAHASPLRAFRTDHNVNAMAFSPDGRTLATGGTDQTTRLWNVTKANPTLLLGPPLTGHTNFVNVVVFSPDGRTLATGSADHTARLWNVPYSPLTGHTGPVSSAMVFSPDGQTLATGSGDQTVRLWKMTDPARPSALGRPLTGHTAVLGGVAFSSDGRTLATGSADETVRLWNMTDPAHPTPVVQRLTGHTGLVRSVAFSPVGHILAVGSGDQTVRLWDVSDSAHPTLLGQPLIGHTGWVDAVAFSPDGHTLATGSLDKTVRLWDVTDPARPAPLGQPLIGHTNNVYSVAFSPDGRTLATGSWDRTVRLWDVADLSARGQPLTGHAHNVNVVAFSPDGHTLASGSQDGSVRLWGMNVDQAISRICATTRNILTPEKWEQYVSEDLPYNPPCP
ncbi:MAG: WD40 repeat domain-containing protein [Pseudonocardiales bacterium]